MKLSRHILSLFVSFLLTITLFAQPGFKVDVEKPKPYQERKLKAEKTGEGKLKPVKRIWQNLSTRFNYIFNANNRLAEVLDRARQQHKDDYSSLLSFYDYDLNTTAADSAQLDSIIYKARTGILNHDLRMEWGDELYLLWAQSWHLQKKLDSASLMLQFINYAYAPQYEDGYYKYIGTHNDGDRELSIVTKEEKHFLHSNTFGRNNAFIWQVRTRTEMDDYTTAGSLITTLRRDPIFPKRLLNNLDEAEAYWNYRQQHWDSAAVHLLAALDGDYSKLEKARWTYLAAQMMEKAGKKDEAVNLYNRVVKITPDPVMDVYARLNLVRLSPGGDDVLEKNVAELLHMAKKDKYEDYRDIIYYMAAQMELEHNNIAAATDLLIKGSKFDNGNIAARNKAFLQIADALYAQKKYLPSASFYDSVAVETLEEKDAARVNSRKPSLEKVVLYSGTISRQDSLQRVAALPKEERDALIKKTVKRLRKQQGLKEEAAAPTSGSGFASLGNAPPTDLFSTQDKGEWYFYNSNAKAQGSAQFQSVWGTRPNVDNWRRSAVANRQALASPDEDNTEKPTDEELAGAQTGPLELTFEGLLGQLPTTPEAVKASNDSIRNALYDLGTTYLNEMEDYPSAIEVLEELRRRFPDAPQMDEVLFNLHYAYAKSGNAASAAAAKKELTEKFSQSRYATIAATGKDPQAKTANSPEATKDYENVYNLFIEGAFAEAEKQKRIADSTYQTNFWQPQLLYIEAVYYIKQRQDSTARQVLETIVAQNTNPALSAKAQNLMDVLSRRSEIEDELTKLQITRPTEDTAASQPVAYQKPPEIKDTVTAAKPETKPAVDSAALAKQRAKEISDSIALSKATAKRLKDSLETAKRDSLALAKKEAAKALRDSLERKAIADKAKRDSLAQKALADKARADSITTAKALQEQARKDSLAAARAAREEARRDSLALAKAMQEQARDSLALSKYLAKRKTDSLARITRDSIALVKKQAAQARTDSLARAALAAKRKQDSLLLAKEQAAAAKRDSLAAKALLAKQRQDSIALAKEEAARLRRDSLAQKALADRQRRDSIAADRAAREQARRDSIALARSAKPPIVSAAGYTFNPGEAHYAVVVLDKVDPIFVGEAKNAFTRYNQENYNGQPLNVQIVNVTADTRLLIISGLPSANAATNYVEKTKPLAATEIVPWLKGAKYSFTIISAPNLEILKSRTNMDEYQKFLEQHLPGKF